MGGLDAGTRAAAVRAPAFVRRIDPGQTGWFSSPSLVDLDGDHRLEIVAPFYSTYVYSAAGRRLATGTATTGREYAPSVVADLDRDGSPEIVVGGTGTVAAYGWRGGRPICPDGDWYPPSGIPAPALVDLTGDGRPEIVFPGDDGYVYAISSTGKRLWRWGYAPGRARTFASEVVAADLNGDGVPELVFGVYGLAPGSGRLVVLSATGARISDQRLPRQGTDGNGIGVAAAPSVADLDGNGALEIVTTSIDHGLDVFTVPGSRAGRSPWPTGRGSLLRAGTGPA